MFRIEKFAMFIAIVNNENKIIEEFEENKNGVFPYWDENTLKRAENRFNELNKQENENI